MSGSLDIPPQMGSYLNENYFTQVETEVKENCLTHLEELIKVIVDNPEKTKQWLDASPNLKKRCVTLIQKAQTIHEIDQKSVEIILQRFVQSKVIVPDLHRSFLNDSLISEIEEEVDKKRLDRLKGVFKEISYNPEAAQGLGRATGEQAKRWFNILKKARLIDPKTTDDFLPFFFQHKIFSSKNFPENMFIVGKGGVRVYFNKELLEFFSDYYKARLDPNSAYKDKAIQTGNGLRMNQEVSGEVLGAFKSYLADGTLPPDPKKLTQLVEFFHLILINPEVYASAKNTLDHLSSVKNLSELSDLFGTIEKTAFTKETQEEMKENAIIQYFSKMNLTCIKREGEEGLTLDIPTLAFLLEQKEQDFVKHLLENYFEELIVTKEELPKLHLIPIAFRNKLFASTEEKIGNIPSDAFGCFLNWRLIRKNMHQYSDFKNEIDFLIKAAPLKTIEYAVPHSQFFGAVMRYVEDYEGGGEKYEYQVNDNIKIRAKSWLS